MLNYYVIDLETNGLSVNYHEVVEISIIRTIDRKQLTRIIKCDYPSRSSIDALEITKKTYADLAQGISKQQAVEDANKFFNEDGSVPAGRCILGHNIWNFDRKFLFWLWETCGLEFPAHLWLDTITLTKQFIKENTIEESKIIKTATGKISTTLHASCEMLDIKKVGAAHSAKMDTRNTYMLWKKLVDEYKIDYLPHIKTFIHSIKNNNDMENIDDLVAELGDV